MKRRRNEAIHLSPAVREALDAGRPVVGLESSVLAQGLPAPANREAADRMRAAVSGKGATPAVTAVVRGRTTAGLEGEDLERFLRRDGIAKVSARDLPVAMASNADGATTVAATLAICVAAEIQVMATGGIGGVHHEPAFDESPDLIELSRSPVVVVCSGAKSILDLPATVERLETLGILVLAYGTDEFPGFLTSRTGLPVAARVESARDVARVARQAWRLGRPGAILVVQPPPKAAAIDSGIIARAVKRALVAMKEEEIRGAAVTPFLLRAVEHETGGRSLTTNVALLEANSALAAEIAVALAAPP
jgi:pseudouridine-5'-phosphate glycosidase